MPSSADEIVSGIQSKWAAALSKLDADALASLYSRHALFFGSNPKLYRGRDGVTSYFKGLPRWRTSAVLFSDVVAEQAGPDLVNFAGTASFDADEGAVKLSVKITWVIAREDGDWKILSHHVSPKAPLI